MRSCAAFKRIFRRLRCANDANKPRVRLRMRTHTPLTEVARALFKMYRRRTLVGLLLMTAQAFFYNAVFFTYALILTNFYGIPAGQIGWYILPFAAGNVLGPIVLGRLFDTIGRRTMVAATYAISGTLLAVTGYLFSQSLLFGAGAHRGLDDRVLFRLSGRKFCLSDGERDLPAGNSRSRHRILLCDRYRRRRRRGPVAVRRIDRYGIPRQRCARLCARRFSDDRGRDSEATWGVAAERKSLETVARPLSFVE